MSSSLLLLLFPLNMNRQMYFIFRSVCFKPKFMLKAEKLNTDFLLQNLNLASFFLSLSLPFLSWATKRKRKRKNPFWSEKMKSKHSKTPLQRFPGCCCANRTTASKHFGQCRSKNTASGWPGNRN